MVKILGFILSTVRTTGELYTEEQHDLKKYHLAAVRRVDCGEQEQKEGDQLGS